MLTEADIRMEIDEALKNKNWILTGKDKNVFAEKNIAKKRPDYVLIHKGKPLIIIEAKRKGKDLISALEQARKYAIEMKAPIVYATDGSNIKTLHIQNNEPIYLNGEEVDEFINLGLALQYLTTNDVYTIDKKVIQSRQELIQVFSSANKELRKEGLQAGIERFSEFCTILFLKLYSEQEVLREINNEELRIEREFRWDFFKNKEGNELLSYVNDIVIKNHFQKSYGSDIFSPLKIKNPQILKTIIEGLDKLSLLDINSDIKGDAFEYFLKAYLAKQHKDLGEYFTPRHIVKTLVKLINPKFGETIYDPFCGTGGMLIESFRHIYNKMPRNDGTLSFLKQKTIFGREITSNARITKMNMILTGDGHNNIERIDSLANPIKDKFDIVITNMPFSLGNFDEYADLYPLGNPNGNFLCIEHCLSSVKKGGRIGIIVPEGILFDRKYRKLREYIYKNAYVENIVSLPQGSFKPYTDVKTSIIFLKNIKEKIPQKFLWYFIVKNDGYTLNTKRKKQEGNSDLDIFLSFNNSNDENNLLHLGFDKLNVSDLKQNEYISIPNHYKKFNYDNSDEIIECKDVIEEMKLINNGNKINKVWSVTTEGFIESKERFKEKVQSDDISKYKLVPPNCFAYNPSRINVGSIAVNLDNDYKCVSPMYVVFKIKNELNLNLNYFFWILKSNNVKEQIKYFSFGTVRQTLNFVDFCKIKIPIINLKNQNIIIECLKKYTQIIENSKKIIFSYIPYLPVKKNWQIKLIGDLCTTQYGYTTNTYLNNSPNNFRYVRTTDILDFFNLHNKDPKYIGYSKNIEKYILKNEDVIITRSGSVGNSFYVDKIEKPMVFASYLVRLLFNKDLIIPKYFIYFSKTNHYWEQVNLLKDVLTQPNLNAEKMKLIKIPLPSKVEQEMLIKNWELEREEIEKNKNTINLFENRIKDVLDSLWEQ